MHRVFYHPLGMGPANRKIEDEENQQVLGRKQSHYIAAVAGAARPTQGDASEKK